MRSPTRARLVTAEPVTQRFSEGAHSLPNGGTDPERGRPVCSILTVDFLISVENRASDPIEIQMENEWATWEVPYLPDD
jgi:hypothetical protein